MKRELLMTISIPVIFSLGIAAFFLLFSPESITLMNFTSYAASLSTVIMVLVYILTTSRQLNAMRSQLEEMKASRNLQIQPLPFPTPMKAYLEKPRFWAGPPDWEMGLCYRIFIEISVQNIGNGAAVAINFDPELRFERKDGLAKIGVRWSPLDSLRQGAKEKIEFMFPDEQATMINNALYDQDFSATMDLVTLFKNALGGSFKSNATYLLSFSDEDEEKLKSWLKTLQTAKIDYAKEIGLHRKLLDEDKISEAHAILTKASEELQKKTDFRDMPFEVELWEGSFSVTPMTEEEYKKEVALRGKGTRAAVLCQDPGKQKFLEKGNAIAS